MLGIGVDQKGAGSIELDGSKSPAAVSPARTMSIPMMMWYRDRRGANV
jgi:hypothetical protein